MQKMKKIFSIIFLIIILVFTVNFSYAQNTPKPAEIPKDTNAPIQTTQNIIDLFGGILRILSIIFWIFAVAASFYAGYLYLLSGGNEEKTGKAKKMLLYAVIAIAIGLMAYGLPQLVKNFLEIGNSSGVRV
jgi:uncharacterized SAM-binding protein YcdF (DUF218 family)